MGGAGMGGMGGSGISACANAAPNPATGQRCPLYTPCQQGSECGVSQGCQTWYCSLAKTCQLLAKSGCWQKAGGNCSADVVFTHYYAPPVDKDFLAPDGISLRELASVVLEIKNNTSTKLYLDELPLGIDLGGNGSKYDVDAVKVFQDFGGSEHDKPGDSYVCLQGDPFSFPANGILSGCSASSFAGVPANGTRRFLLNLAFVKSKSYIAGRSYRLRIPSLNGVKLVEKFNGPAFGGTMCGISPQGYTGAWIHAK